MDTIYLSKSDIEKIKAFLETFPKDIVMLTSDRSSGIGTIIKAHVIGVDVRGHTVTVTKDIVDESSW